MKRPAPDPIVLRRRVSPLRVPSSSVEVLDAPRAPGPRFFAAELDAEETKRSTLRVLEWPAKRVIVIDKTPDLSFDVQLAPSQDGTLYIRISARGP